MCCTLWSPALSHWQLNCLSGLTHLGGWHVNIVALALALRAVTSTDNVRGSAIMQGSWGAEQQPAHSKKVCRNPGV
jgi:hypothetical protein